MSVPSFCTTEKLVWGPKLSRTPVYLVSNCVAHVWSAVEVAPLVVAYRLFREALLRFGNVIVFLFSYCGTAVLAMILALLRA